MAETLIDAIQDRVRNQGDSLALTMLQDGTDIVEQVTFAELHHRALVIAAALRAKDLQNHRAILLYPAGIEFACAFLGCLYSGVAPVPAPPPEPSRLKRSLPRLLSIVEDCDASVILTETSAELVALDLIERGIAALEVIETDRIKQLAPATGQPLDIKPSDLCYLQYTSGSTSNPQGIKVSHFNLLYQLKYLQKTCSYNKDSVTVTWMPNFHDWGLIEGLLESIYNGTPCYLMAPISFVRRPRNWLAAISKFRGTHAQGPTFAYAHCQRRISEKDATGLDLCSWRAAGIAAEPINYTIMKGFYDYFHKCGFQWSTFSPAFGLGEATLKVSCCGEGEEPTVLQLDAEQLEQNRAVIATERSTNVRTVVSSGRAHGETEIAIVDPEKFERLADSKVGEIWIRDPSVADGYWNRQPESELTFQAQLTDGTGPFLRTGDLGFLLDEQLYVTGRLKDLIIVRGSNHYPQDIEWTAQNSHERFWGQNAAAFSIDQEDTEKLVLLQELDRNVGSDEEFRSLMSAIVNRVSNEHELEVFDMLLLKRGTIPKTASGKLRRRSCKHSYLQDEFKPLARWSKLDLSPGPVIEVRCEQKNQEWVPIQNNAHELLADSKADELIEWLREYAGKRINSLLMDQRRSIAPHVVLDFGNRGIFGIQVPGSYGGLGLSFRNTMRVFEQLAAIDVSLATIVFLSNTNGLRPIMDFGSEKLKAELLPSLAAGRRLAAFALSEPGAGSNIGAIQTRATRQEQGDWRLAGQKRWNGSSWADVITVIAREYDSQGESLGVTAFLIRQSMQGVRIGDEALTLGMRSIVQNSLHLDEVLVDDAQILGNSGAGLDIVNHTLSVGRLSTASVCLGGMKRAAQLLLRYSSRRKISTGMLLEHPHTLFQLEKIVFQTATIENLVNYLSAQLDAAENAKHWTQTNPLLMMVAKVLASEYFNRSAAWTVQLMGGRGYMENNEAARLLRDARALSIGEGPNESLISHLGQSSNIGQLVQWLQSNVNVDFSNRLKTVVDEIHTKCASRADLTTLHRRLWSEYLSGQVGLEFIATGIVTLNSVSNEDTRGVINWCQAQLESAIQNAISYSECCPISRPISSIQGAVEGYSAQIGEIDQQLPGEDQDLDSLLSGQESDANSPAIGDNQESEFGSQSESADLRKKLNALLKKKIREH